jgi:hypothetical protein
MASRAARDRCVVVMAGAACLQDAVGPRQTGKFVWTAGKLGRLVGGWVQGGLLNNEISSILHGASVTILYRVNCGSWHCGLKGLGSVLSIYKSLFIFYVIAYNNRCAISVMCQVNV